MSNILRFDLSPNQIKFKNILNKEFVELEIWAISDINPNRNKSHFTLESIEKSIDCVKNTPIVGFFENNDFTTHEGKADYDSEYKKQFWNTERGERILGWVRESDPVEIVEKDELHWLKFRCVLCTTYCYRQVKRLLRDKKKKVSVEVTIHNSEVIDGIENIYDFTLNGVAILGSKHGKPVMEGIPGAHLSVLDLENDNAIQEQRRVLSFAYQQMDGAGDENIIADNDSIGDENIKKEVNQADMDTIEVEQIEETEVLVAVDEQKDEEVELSCEDGEMACEEVKPEESEEPVKAPEEDNDDHKDLEDPEDHDEEPEEAKDEPEEDEHDDDGDSDDDDDKPNDENKEEDLDAEEPACCEDKQEVENVSVEEVAPDVNVIVEDDSPVNEEEDSLSMTTEDIGVPQCEEPPVEMECGEPALEAEVEVVAEDEETKVDEADDYCGENFEEKYKELEAKYAELECKMAEKDAKIAECEAKCADYDEIYCKLQAAEAKIKERFYSDLKLFAQGIMANENISKEYQDDILSKCSAGHYSCEDDVKKDVAIAIYSSRPAKEKMFSISIPVMEERVEVKKPATREQYLKDYISKKK